MKTTFLGLLAAVALVSAAPAKSGSDECSALYSQCGGKGWTGSTCCVEGSKCVAQSGNEYYSQCLPGTNMIINLLIQLHAFIPV